MQFFKPSVASCSLNPVIPLSTLFSDILNQYTSLNLRVQVQHPYKVEIRGKPNCFRKRKLVACYTGVLVTALRVIICFWHKSLMTKKATRDGCVGIGCCYRVVSYKASLALLPFYNLLCVPIRVLITPDSSTRALWQIPSETPSSEAAKNAS
jgi:hypothetical protein